MKTDLKLDKTEVTESELNEKLSNAGEKPVGGNPKDPTQ